MFDIFHIFVKCEFEDLKLGYSSDAHLARIWSDVLLAVSIYPLLPNTLSARWILSKGGW